MLLKWKLDALAWVLGERGRAWLPPEQTLDVAGAIISPLCGALACIYLAWWARREVRGATWVVPPLFFALSPILVHGTHLGRPDHQAPVILLLLVAVTGELSLLRGAGTEAGRRWWLVVTGVAWGMGLWVSLFEPLIWFLGVGVMVGILEWRFARRGGRVYDQVEDQEQRGGFGWRGRWVEGAVVVPGMPLVGGRVYDQVEDQEQRGGFGWRGRRLEGAVVLVLLVLMVLVEGSPIPHLAPEVKEYFGRWGTTVAELRPLRVGDMLLYEWLGFGCVAAPVVLAIAGRRDRRAWVVLALLAGMFFATWGHLRWGYYLALAYAVSLPWQTGMWRRQWVVWVLVAASWYPLAQSWDKTLYPDEEERLRRAEQRKERVLLRQIAAGMREEDGVAPFLAPWWLSPALSYWSGQPGVAGSSHEGMPGIVDSARFFLAEDPEEARAVLERRRIAFVVVDEPSRTVDTAVPLLGKPAPAKPLGKAIYEAPHRTPGFLRLRLQNQYYKLFWVETTRG